MKQLEQVTQTQLMMFSCMFTYSSNIGFLISPIIGSGNYSAWISLIIANLIALIFVYITVYICENCPLKSFLDHGDKIITKWVHFAFLLYLGYYFFHYSALLSRLFQDFMIQTYLPTTPDWVVSCFICLLAVVAVWSGIESIFRFAQLFFFLTIISGASIPTLIATELEYDMAIAFVNHIDILQIFGTTMYAVPWYTDIIIIVLFYQMIRSSKKSLKSITIGLGLTSFLILPNLIITIAIFRPYYASDLTYPVLEVIRQISLGNFVENLDPVLVSVWMTTITIKISICLYGAIIVTAKLLNINNYRFLVLPYGLFLFGYSIQMGGTATEINHFLTQGWAGYGWTIIFVLVIYFIVLNVRRRTNSNPAIKDSEIQSP